MNIPLIECIYCGAKNRVPLEKKGTAKCGRCRQPLQPAQGLMLTLRCGQCRTKNRVPAEKLHEGAKCGRCKSAIEHQDVLTGHTLEVTDSNFDQKVLRSPLPVLLYAWAPWCSVCKTTGPVVDRLGPETKEKIRVGKLNVDVNPVLAAKYNILSVPAFFIFDAGQLKHHMPGALPKHELLLKMASYI